MPILLGAFGKDLAALRNQRGSGALETLPASAQVHFALQAGTGAARHFATGAGIEVLDYTDEAEARLEAGPGTAGRRVMKITRVTLRPRIRVAAGTDPERALALVGQAHAGCFIANSVTCEVTSEPEVIVV